MSGKIIIVSKPPKLERKKRVAAYARVSSGKDAMLHSLSAQVSYYNDLIQNHGDWLYAGVYSDEAKTGTKDSRSGFQNLVADCRDGKIDMVITNPSPALHETQSLCYRQFVSSKHWGWIFILRNRIFTL